MSSAMLPRDKWIPWYFVVFFAIIALVDGVMVTLAVTTFSGTVTDHPYEKGLAYNEVIKAAQNQAQLGWHSDITYHEKVLDVTLKDKDKQLIAFEKGTAIFTRPTQAGMDVTLDIHPGANRVELPARGVWDVRIHLEYQQQHYQASERVVVP